MVDEHGREIEIKTDCFAYRNSLKKAEGSCMCMRELYCKKEICKFYKPADQVKEKYWTL